MTNNDTQQAFDIQEIINLIDDRQNDNDPRAEEAKKSLEKLRQALQSQAEKDRVMKLMAEALESCGVKKDRSLIYDIDLVDTALSEYTKLQGGTQDE